MKKTPKARSGFQRHAALVPLVVAMLAAGGAGTAAAQDQSAPWYVGAYQAFTHESNLYRRPDGQPKTSDLYSSTGLLGGLNLPISRQRVFADANVRRNIFQDEKHLNNTSYGLTVGADLETINRISGRVAYTRKQNLARYGAENAPQITERNLEKSQEFEAIGRIGLVSLFTLEAGYRHRTLDYTAAAYDPLESKQDSVSIGTRYWPSDLLNYGVALRHTEGEFPRFQAVAGGGFNADEFTRNDIDFTAAWQPSGLSTLTGRLSLTRVEHDLASVRDVSGVTGAVTWDYRPTGKLRLSTQFARDTGQEIAFINFSEQISAVGENSRLTNRFQVQAFWDATAKIRADARVRLARRSFSSSTPGIADGHDTTRQLALGVRYAPTRAWLLGCAIAHETRSAPSTFSFPYDANSGSCYAQLTLQ